LSRYVIANRFLRVLGWLALLAHPGLILVFAVGFMADAQETPTFLVAALACLFLILAAVLAAIIHSNLVPPATEIERRQAQRLLWWAASLSTAFYLIGLPPSTRT
jgi:membrane protease YdiL (CAAX protease family)